MTIRLPELCLVLLVGPSCSGKTTFARAHFKPSAVLSSDCFRAAITDDESDQSVTADAFDLMQAVAAKRLAHGRLTVIDATNVQRAARQRWIELARAHDVLCVAIVFDLPEAELTARLAQRGDRAFGAGVIRNQCNELRRSRRGFAREGLRHVHVLDGAEAAGTATIERTRLWSDLRHETGPFDIVGDVHGCLDELLALTAKLGYACTPTADAWQVSHPEGRKLVFVGDLVDRGPDSPGVVRLVRSAVDAGVGFCVAGNHDARLAKALGGRPVRVSHGLEKSLEQMEAVPPDERRAVAAFLGGLVSHYVLDDGKLVVAHAGLKEAYHGRASARVRDFALYGDTTGETDALGLPVRHDWAAAYRGQALVVFGHTPVAEAQWVNGTVCLDTACVFGGALTALRYPERELVSVPAARAYCAPLKPLQAPAEAPEPAATAQQQADGLLDITDVAGPRRIHTRSRGHVVVREQEAAAALEAMGRFAVDPRWLIYLPPTMSPPETAAEPGLLEHPAEALAYYRRRGVAQVMCQQKHMGSRAVVIVCRDAASARRRFGTTGDTQGIVYTRSGRRFFADEGTERAVLTRLADAAHSAGLWDELGTDWLCLDAELMPWSAKAGELIRTQYAPVGMAGAHMLGRLQRLLNQAAQDGRPVGELLARTDARCAALKAYGQVWRRYSWPVERVDDLRLAPFQLLASEGQTHLHRDHAWHLQMIGRLVGGASASRQDRHTHALIDTQSEWLITTPHRVVDLNDAAQCEAAVAWWQALTASGAEGMVVKPMTPPEHDAERRALQPAIKCRGAEYLRLIYGPEYLLPEHLARLRERSVAAKRRLALAEHALGAEALARFVGHAPLRAVHECVMGVLALESEAVDSRL